mmetsp:Transcript_36846/g.86071  ORF Transcript_36846/g.86071 Transcript_36846/m.86071 type:complete len:310 (-) Transcript_36846:128-1057(-)
MGAREESRGFRSSEAGRRREGQAEGSGKWQRSTRRGADQPLARASGWAQPAAQGRLPPTTGETCTRFHRSCPALPTNDGLVVNDGIEAVAVSPRPAPGWRFRGDAEKEPVELHGDDHELKADCAEPMEMSERVGEKGRGESESDGKRTWERLSAWMLADARCGLTRTAAFLVAWQPPFASAAACSGTTSSWLDSFENSGARAFRRSWFDERSAVEEPSGSSRRVVAAERSESGAARSPSSSSVDESMALRCPSESIAMGSGASAAPLPIGYLQMTGPSSESESERTSSHSSSEPWSVVGRGRKRPKRCG